MTTAARQKPKSDPLLRPLWIPIFRSSLALALLLSLFAAAVRALGLLGPPQYFWVLPLGFVILAIAPWVFVTREGRALLGLRLPRQPAWIAWGVLLGGASAVVCYWLGVTWFGETADNWFVSVQRSFPLTPEMSSLTSAQLFWIISIPSLIFSPLGEEIFFRGLLHQAVEDRRGYTSAVIVDAGAFAFVHLFHHGLVRIDGALRVLPLSGAIWMALIFAVGVLFAFLRRKTGSLAAPILSHAAFNLAMNYTIFYHL